MMQQDDCQYVFNFNLITKLNQQSSNFITEPEQSSNSHRKMTSLTAQSRTLKPSFQQSIKACIQDVSVKQNYQHKLMAFFTLVAFSTTLQIFSSSLLYMNPVFQCASQKVFEEEACPQINFCNIKNTGTITAQLNLFCDSRKHERNMLQTGVGFGCWLGIILAALSDRIGKKLSFCLGLFLLNLTWIFEFAGVYFQNVTLLFLSEVISGISNKAIYVAFIVLLTRFLNKDGYELGTLIWYIAFHGLSQVIIAGINATFENWRAVAYVYSVGISVCSIAALFVLKEDPVFLFDVGRIDELKQVVTEIGRQNEAEQLVMQSVLCRIDQLDKERNFRIQNNLKRHGSFNIKEILRGDIMKAIILIGLSAALYQMAIKSIQLSIQSLESSYNFNLFIGGIANICGFLTAIYITKIEPKRKRGLILSSLLYGAIAMLFLFPFCYQNGGVETAVIFVIRFFLCWGCIFLTRLKVDSFPQRYQMTIISLVQTIGTIGIVLAPSIVQHSVDHSISPIVAVSILRIIIGTLPMFFHTEQHIHLHSEEPSYDAEAKQDKIFNNID